MRRPIILVAIPLLATALAGPARSATDCGIPPGSERCARWTSRYDGAGGGSDIANAVAIAPSGAVVFVTGASPGAGTGNDFATVAYDAATGASLWAARYDNGGDDQARALVVSRDGTRVFVTGPSAGSNVDYATVAYDAASGAELWSARFDGERALSDYPIAIGVGPEDARVYVTGYTDGGLGASELDYATVAYDAASGEQRWVDVYNGPANFWDVASDLGVGFLEDEEGRIHDRVYVTGRSNGASNSNDHTDFGTLAYDGETGARLWVARYDGPTGGREYPYALAVSGDGNRVYVLGESVGAGTGFDYATVAYDAQGGGRLWVHRYEYAYDDRPLDVAVAPGGARVYVTGFSSNNGNNVDRSAATVAIDASTGSQVWAARRTGPAGEAASAIAVGPDGRRIYVAGLSGGLVFGVGVNALGVAVGYAGYMAAAYDATAGTEAWVAHHGGVATDAFLRGAVLAPDGGRLFVTGGAAGDYTTLAYDT